MKSFKNGILSLLILLSISCIFTSCSKEEGVTQNNKISSYLKSFYSKKTKFGNSFESKIKLESSVSGKSEEFDDVVITEVFVGDEEKARGYTITSKDSNVFLYFIDVDRIEYKMTTVDIEADQAQILENIDQLDKYVSTNQFDFIKITQDLINQNGQAGTLASKVYSYGGCKNGWRGVYQASSIFGIRIGSWTAVTDENGPVIVPCDQKYSLDTH